MVYTTQAFSFNLWKKTDPEHAQQHLVKLGVTPTVAQAALKGLSEEQLSQLSSVHLRILAKLLNLMEKTILDADTLAAKVVPGLSENPQLVEHLAVYSATMVRQMTETLFEIMEGQSILNMTKNDWKQIVGKGAHSIIQKTLCKNFTHSSIITFCESEDSRSTSSNSSHQKSKFEL